MFAVRRGYGELQWIFFPRLAHVKFIIFDLFSFFAVQKG